MPSFSKYWDVIKTSPLSVVQVVEIVKTQGVRCQKGMILFMFFAS